MDNELTKDMNSMINKINNISIKEFDEISDRLSNKYNKIMNFENSTIGKIEKTTEFVFKQKPIKSQSCNDQNWGYQVIASLKDNEGKAIHRIAISNGSKKLVYIPKRRQYGESFDKKTFIMSMKHPDMKKAFLKIKQKELFDALYNVAIILEKYNPQNKDRSEYNMELDLTEEEKRLQEYAEENTNIINYNTMEFPKSSNYGIEMRNNSDRDRLDMMCFLLIMNNHREKIMEKSMELERYYDLELKKIDEINVEINQQISKWYVLAEMEMGNDD